MIDLQVFKEMVKHVRLTTPYDSHLKIALQLGCNNRYLSGVLSGRMKLSNRFVENFLATFNMQDFHINQQKEQLISKEPTRLLSTDVVLSAEVFELIKTQAQTILSQQQLLYDRSVEQKDAGRTEDEGKQRVSKKSVKKVS